MKRPGPVWERTRNGAARWSARSVGEGVVPGDGLGPFTMESGLGYTGEQSLAEMLGHRDFVDVKIELFVKHRAEQWAKLGEFPIARQLLTQ